MTEAVLPTPNLGHVGVWTRGPVMPAQAVEIEGLSDTGRCGSAESCRAASSFVEPILEPTDTLVATGSPTSCPVTGSLYRGPWCPRRCPTGTTYTSTTT